MAKNKVGFGKHKGLSWEEILKKDRSYIEWLLRTTKDANLWVKLKKLLG